MLHQICTGLTVIPPTVLVSACWQQGRWTVLWPWFLERRNHAQVLRNHFNNVVEFNKVYWFVQTCAQFLWVQIETENFFGFFPGSQIPVTPNFLKQLSFKVQICPRDMPSHVTQWALPENVWICPFIHHKLPKKVQICPGNMPSHVTQWALNWDFVIIHYIGWTEVARRGWRVRLNGGT